jgi:hypothetical protein
MLPELPTSTTPITTVGAVRELHGRRVVVLDYAAPRGPNRGRRFRVDSEPATTGCSRVVFNVDGRAALRPPPWTTNAEVTLRLRALPAPRAHRVPGDLRHALSVAGLDLDHITAPELEQMLEMIVEAHDGILRAARIDIVVAAVAAAATDRKQQP